MEPRPPKTREAPKTLADNGKEAVRFAIIGVTSTLSYGASMALLVTIGALSASVANPIASLVSFLVSFFGHRHYTFRTGTDWRAELRRFVPVALGQLVASQSIVTLTDLNDWHPLIATVVVMVVIPLASYVVNKIWVFRYGRH